eukprot:GHVS01046721.1.p1 GENE.GHVS01046721.1~~GHVS01046721.1.p1  ORF type:complete len:561 (-),score=60.64 GHVS01046721.1:80-1762(-)
MVSGRRLEKVINDCHEELAKKQFRFEDDFPVDVLGEYLEIIARTEDTEETVKSERESNELGPREQRTVGEDAVGKQCTISEASREKGGKLTLNCRPHEVQQSFGRVEQGNKAGLKRKEGSEPIHVRLGYRMLFKLERAGALAKAGLIKRLVVTRMIEGVDKIDEKNTADGVEGTMRASGEVEVHFLAGNIAKAKPVLMVATTLRELPGDAAETVETLETIDDKKWLVREQFISDATCLYWCWSEVEATAVIRLNEMQTVKFEDIDLNKTQKHMAKNKMEWPKWNVGLKSPEDKGVIAPELPGPLTATEQGGEKQTIDEDAKQGDQKISDLCTISGKDGEFKVNCGSKDIPLRKVLYEKIWGFVWAGIAWKTASQGQTLATLVVDFWKENKTFVHYRFEEGFHDLEVVGDFLKAMAKRSSKNKIYIHLDAAMLLQLAFKGLVHQLSPCFWVIHGKVKVAPLLDMTNYDDDGTETRYVAPENYFEVVLRDKSVATLWFVDDRRSYLGVLNKTITGQSGYGDLDFASRVEITIWMGLMKRSYSRTGEIQVDRATISLRQMAGK